MKKLLLEPFISEIINNLRGLDPTAVPHLEQATQYLLALLYGWPAEPTPVPKNARKLDRNVAIHALYAQGFSIPQLARQFGISNARVHQILRGSRN